MVTRGPDFFRSFWLIYRRDSMLERRSPAGFLSSLLFGVTLAVIYHYAMADSVFKDAINLHGVALASLFFTASIAAGRNVNSELEAGALRSAILAPADPAGYFLGKTAALWQLQILFCAAILPIYRLLLTGAPPELIREFFSPLLVLTLTALPLSALGILLAYIARGTRMKELLFPLLLLPAALPLFINAAHALQEIQTQIYPSPAAILALLAPAGLYCGVGSLLFFALAAEE